MQNGLNGPNHLRCQVLSLITQHRLRSCVPNHSIAPPKAALSMLSPSISPARTAYCTKRLSPCARSISASACLYKSGGKQNSKSNVARASQKVSAQSAHDDPFDLTEYEARIADAHAHLKSEVSKIRAGGRDAESIESIRVNLGSGNKGKSSGGRARDDSDQETAKVRDLASVLVKGRNIVVMVGEKDHLKPIMSALLSTNDMMPQAPSSVPGADPLQITIPIPPVTRESREQAAKTVTEKGEAALFALREARGAQKKAIRAIELTGNAQKKKVKDVEKMKKKGGKGGADVGAEEVDEQRSRIVTGDEIRKAEAQMEKVSERANVEVKRIVDDGRKRLLG